MKLRLRLAFSGFWPKKILEKKTESYRIISIIKSIKAQRGHIFGEF